MSQLNPNQYDCIAKGGPYGTSYGLYRDKTNGLLVLAYNDTVVLSVDSSGTILAGALEAADLNIASQARGDILRRGASAWERLSAKDSAKILIGDGTDVVSVAVSGDVTISAAGAVTIGANKVLASMLGANLGKGFIPLDLFGAKIIAANAFSATTEGGIPDTNTDPSIARVNGATDKMSRLVWGAASVVEIQFQPFVYPPDLDDAAAVEVHFLAAMAGATDTPMLGVSYWEGLGDTNAGGNTAAVTGTSIAEYSVSIAAGDVGAHPKVAAIGLTPAAHGTDALHLYAAWVEYTRRS